MSDAALVWLFESWQAGSFDTEDLNRRSRDPRSDPRARADRIVTERDQEHEFIAGIRAGSMEVFRRVFEGYAPRLQHFARLWVPHDVAEDIVQDVLFDMWQRRLDLQPHQNNLTGHLFAAVRNRTRNYLHHHHIVQRVEASESNDSSPGMGMGPRHPDAAMTADDIRTAVASALATLPELQRATLMLRWGEDMSFAQIATVLSISENAAKLHVSRGRRLLAPVLRPLLDD
jgi:RNA polymerase sigma-70 factor (ECF subfamily)